MNFRAFLCSEKFLSFQYSNLDLYIEARKSNNFDTQSKKEQRSGLLLEINNRAKISIDQIPLEEKYMAFIKTEKAEAFSNDFLRGKFKCFFNIYQIMIK